MTTTPRPENQPSPSFATPDDDLMIDDGAEDATTLQAAPAAPPEAPVLERRDPSEGNRRQRAVFTVPIEVVVSVGRARTPIGTLLEMGRDALIALDSKVDDPVEIRIGDRVIARGDLEEMDDGSGRLGVRLTEIVDMVEMP